LSGTECATCQGVLPVRLDDPCVEVARS
jgi:hypothetical protein